MTAKELWQQHSNEIAAETNPHPPDSYWAPWWDFNRAWRRLGAELMVSLAPIVDFIATLEPKDDDR